MPRKWSHKFGARKLARGGRKPVRLEVEELERRDAPVVGVNAAVVNRGGDFDGVVRLTRAPVIGTGALMDTSRHILTAAHVIDTTQAIQVRFEMVRDGRNVDIDINVPANAAGNRFQVPHHYCPVKAYKNPHK